MKKVIFMFVFLTSLSSLAQRDPTLDFEITPYKPAKVEEEKNTRSNSYNIYYYRSGYSLGSVNERQGSLSLAGIGMKSFTNSFFNGIEYSTHHGIEDLKISGLSFQIGYQFFNETKNKIKPYVASGFGYSSIKDIKGPNPSSNGINISGEVGFEFFRMNFLSLSQGIKVYKNFFEKKEYKNSSIQELYFQINFRF